MRSRLKKWPTRRQAKLEEAGVGRTVPALTLCDDASQVNRILDHRADVRDLCVGESIYHRRHDAAGTPAE